MNELTPKEKQKKQLISVRVTSTNLVGLILGCEWKNPIGLGHIYWTEPQRHFEGFGKASEIFGEYWSLGKRGFRWYSARELEAMECIFNRQ